ncbi:hypothetical protein G3I59_32180 [Amycolatopsis rubida]|uniref:Uncharacterized protein n=1 Tax=Amycolatopsis rubida TaxID=112413 RepID=A0ABX0BRM4_9PSEU|nr:MULTISPECIES: hypothetical protein [Amycolatopsis]MYW90501.1 hypothetical protein [Amycolatopsis rubida]MYW95131.1 hypothetical protein [Amycolatopsis rubida]NEC55480.1 hypothetical protein [Amycolatopsis rubida]NEC60119.1 hypothetical protein [Amycolatopsis rubida]
MAAHCQALPDLRRRIEERRSSIADAADIHVDVDTILIKDCGQQAWHD